MQSQKSLNIVLGFIVITLIISGCNAAVPEGLFVWIDVPQDDPLYAYSSDDYVEISLAKYY